MSFDASLGEMHHGSALSPSFPEHGPFVIGLKRLIYKPFPKQAPVFMCLQYKFLENTVGKGEIARYEQFLLSPFSTLLENFLQFTSNLKLSSANFFCWEESKICRMVKG